MTTGLVILIPVLGRPNRVLPVLESIRAATPGARVLFLPDPDDVAERQAIAAAGAEELPVDGNYAAKANAGVRATTEPYVFLGADDLLPHPGWFEVALSYLRDGVQVVGVNDLIPRSRDHATHFVLDRAYAERPTIDGGRGPMHEGYNHWWIDNELIATATARDAYVYAREAVVEHLHPFAQNGVPWDSTYEKGRSRRRHDRLLFRERSALWAA